VRILGFCYCADANSTLLGYDVMHIVYGYRFTWHHILVGLESTNVYKLTEYRTYTCWNC